MTVSPTDEADAECFECYYTWHIEAYRGSIQAPQCPRCGAFNVKLYRDHEYGDAPSDSGPCSGGDA